MPGQMTTELRCRAMLSLQQLYTPENLVFFVRGVRVEARGKSRYKLISLTFQETLLSSPPPLSLLLILTSHKHFLRSHRDMSGPGWHRGGWETAPERRLMALIMIPRGRFAESLRWSGKQESRYSHSLQGSAIFFTPPPTTASPFFLLLHWAWPSPQNSLHPFWENRPFSKNKSLMLTLIVPIPAAQ